MQHRMIDLGKRQGGLHLRLQLIGIELRSVQNAIQVAKMHMGGSHIIAQGAFDYFASP